MAGGLLALLDDVAALARLAAASADDVAAVAGRAGTKAMGVVIDDAAVTPGYVVGLPPQRELPIIGKIALGSVRNKLVFILPVALLLSSWAPWALPPLLMAGGLYLCLEGAEKILKALGPAKAEHEVASVSSPEELEQRQVGGAIRTDFILSAEIMVIALAEVAGQPVVTRAIVLALVGIAVTAAVYGAVALLVKMDDIGLRLARGGGVVAGFGRGLVWAMPVLLRLLSLLGVAAMLWVGGGILVHGLAGFGVHAPEQAMHRLAEAVGGGAAWAEWLVTALCSGLVGLVAGGIVAGLLHLRPGKHH